MSDSEETIYSTMFKSLKHPVRRKILRVLSDKATSFSDMLEELGVSSSHLTYHLESLGELVTKLESGNYKLSTFGEAAVNTMKVVEDAPVVQTSQKWSMSFRWKPVFGVLVIGIVLLASFSVLQLNTINLMSSQQSQLQAKYNELLSFTASTDKAISFLRDVIELDLTKYDAELLSNTVSSSTILKGVVEQNLVYSLTSSDTRMTVNFRFRNNMLSSYSVSLLDGAPIYAGAQPFVVLDSAKWLVQKMISYEDAPYLGEMNNTLYQINNAESGSIQLKDGNLKFNMSISGANAEMEWYYTQDGVDFASKSLELTFTDLTLKELDDSYFLYKIGSTQVNIDQAGAIQTAKDAIKNFPWSGGQQISGYTIDDATAVFDPAPREEPLTLIPRWYVTLYLGNLPTSTIINRIAVVVWADTGKADQIRALSG
jgi:Helix-turn-helix domain